MGHTRSTILTIDVNWPTRKKKFAVGISWANGWTLPKTQISGSSPTKNWLSYSRDDVFFFRFASCALNVAPLGIQDYSQKVTSAGEGNEKP